MSVIGNASDPVFLVPATPGAEEQVVAYEAGGFRSVGAPDWWYDDEWLSSGCVTTSLEVGPLGIGMLARRAPSGFTVCLTGNETCEDVRTIWCPSEADYIGFLCGPGAAFVSACAQILGADPLKRGAWK